MLPAVPRVRPGLRARRPQRAVRRRVPAGTSPSSRAGRGRGSRCSTPPSSPAGWSPATRRPTASSARWRVLFGVDHHAQPPGAVRRPGHRRRAARADGAARQPRACTPSRSCRRSAPGSPPPSAASGTSPSSLPHAPGVYLFQRRPRPGALRRHSPRTCAPGCAPTSPPPRPAPGWARWSASPTQRAGHRVRDPARGRGPRAPADRRAQAALQPPLPVPRAGALGQADRRAVAAAVAGARRSSTTTPTTSGRSPRERAAERSVAALHEAFPIRQCSGRMPEAPAVERLRARRDGQVPVAVRRQRQRRGLRRASSTGSAASLLARPGRRWSPRCRGRMTALADGQRFEDAGSWRDRLGVVPARRRPHPAAARADPAARSSSPPGARTTGWAVHVVRHGRLAAAGVIPPGRARRALGRPAARRRPTRWCPGPVRPRPPRPRRPRRSCAGWSPTGCAWCTSRASGRCPVGGRHQAPARRTTRSRPSRPLRVPVRRTRSRLRYRAPAGPLAWRHDHRHRVRQGRRRPHPRGRRADRGHRRGQRGLLGDRRRST